MVYFKIMLNDKRQKADKIYPVVVRVTFNRSNTTLSTGIRVKSDLWDETHSSVKSSHPNAQAYNKTIADYSSKVQNIAFQLVNDNGFSFEALRDRLSTGYQAPKVTKSALFNVFAQQLIEDMIELNKSGNAMVYKVAVKRFSEHVCNPKLKFSEINYNLLEGFRRQLVKDGVKQNSISNYFRTLRAIYNRAIKAKLVDRSFYPFLDIKIKTERTAKRAITIDELVTLSKVQLKPKSQTWHSRNYFFLSFSLIGISFTDLAYLTPGNIKKGRLTYKRRKTGKELSIKLHPYTESVLSYYKGSNSKYLLPILPANIVEDSMKAKSHLMSRIKQVNKYLNRIVEVCELDCDVTTYVARHSWATTAKRLGYSIELIAEALGHEYGNKITNIYLDSFDQSLIDEANAKVISCLE